MLLDIQDSCYSRITSLATEDESGLLTGRGFFASSKMVLCTTHGDYEFEFRGADKAHIAHNLILSHMGLTAARRPVAARHPRSLEQTRRPVLLRSRDDPPAPAARGADSGPPPATCMHAAQLIHVRDSAVLLAPPHWGNVPLPVYVPASGGLWHA